MVLVRDFVSAMAGANLGSFVDRCVCRLMTSQYASYCTQAVEPCYNLSCMCKVLAAVACVMVHMQLASCATCCMHMCHLKCGKEAVLMCRLMIALACNVWHFHAVEQQMRARPDTHCGMHGGVSFQMAGSDAHTCCQGAARLKWHAELC